MKLKFKKYRPYLSSKSTDGTKEIFCKRVSRPLTEIVTKQPHLFVAGHSFEPVVLVYGYLAF